MSCGGWLLFATAVVGWFIYLRPDSLGGPAGYVSVTGTSMMPALQPGDLVITAHAEAYQVGDVVTYRVPADAAAAGARVIHRIIGLDEAGHFLVRGDNTNGPDVWHPAPSDIVGRVSIVMPGAARLVGLLRQPALIAGLAAAIAVGYILGRPVAPAKTARAGEPAATR